MSEVHNDCDGLEEPTREGPLGEYKRYRHLAETSIAQMPDDALNVVPGTECNSVAMLVAHYERQSCSSRFTNFLTEDGEKPWRERDEEFASRSCTREQMLQMWTDAWSVPRA
jgi:hypothetical protein